MPRSKHRAGRPQRRERLLMFARYGTVCHLCGHDGAGEADHITPLAVWPDQPVDHRLWRPAHGSSAPCPVCRGADGQPRACNQVKGARVEAVPTDVPLRTSRRW